MRDAGSGGRYAGRSCATRPDSTLIERVQPTRCAITVAGIVGYARNNSRICGSTAPTIDPAGWRTYFGGASEANAHRTVLRETPNTLAIALIGRPSALPRRRISAQSSTDNIPFAPWLRLKPGSSARGVKIRMPHRDQFSPAADNTDIG